MKMLKLIIQDRSIRTIIFILMLMIGLTSCKTIKSISEGFDNRMEDAISSMDYAIETLAQQSASWQVVVSNLQNNISKDIQSTIQHEITDLTRNAVLSTGAEFRCNAEYMRIKIRRELIDIRNSLAMSLNINLKNNKFKDFQIPLIAQDPIRPFICDIAPTAVNMSLERERRTKIDIYGFDLRSYPITVSYNTYGDFNAKSQNSSSNFFEVMEIRNRDSKHTAYIRDSLIAVDPTSARIISNLEHARKNIIANSFTLISPWKLYVNDVSSSVSIISDFHAVLDLSGSGANLPPNTKEILISWDNKIQSEIPIITYEKVLECRTWDSTIVIKPITFIPEQVTYTHYGGGGNPDFDFDGNGPCIEFKHSIHIDPTKRILYATVFMDAWECDNDFTTIHRDYTQALETRTITLLELNDPDMTIQGINMGTYIFEKYIDSNTNTEIYNYGSHSAVAKINFTGDTYGDEAGSKTGAVITYNPISLKLQKCEYK